MKRVDRALRLSQAAAELGTSRYVLLRLCQMAMVEAERTPGGHWRIPCDEVERLRIEGLPPVPAVLPADDETACLASRRATAEMPDGLYREASDDLADSAESVLLAEHVVRRRRLELERLKVEDELAERAERLAHKEAETWRQATAVAAQRERDQFVRKKLEQATELLAGLKAAEANAQDHIVPLGWRIEFDITVHDILRKSLQKIDPHSISEKLIDALIRFTIVELLKTFRRRQQQEIESRQSDTLKAIVEIAKLLRT